MRRKITHLHDAQLVIVDEAHMQKGKMADAILTEHRQAAANIVLVTATPIDLGLVAGVEPKLVVAGKTSELRRRGALVPARHFGPDEPDTRKVRKQVWEYTENDVRKIMMVQGIFGRVLTEFRRLNPDQRPTILSAPGVQESIWFAQQLTAAGVRSAHIDGKDCWIDGEFHRSDMDVRQQILDGSKDGSIKVVCNRFVLREGIDAPWLAHAIFATIFGSLQSYVQSGGRLLRAFPGLESVTIQDHGGNWHRHGSLNADRLWNLAWTEAMVQGLRQERMRRKEEAEPFLCPQCKQVLTCSECPCGFKVTRKVRPVVQHDGTIREHEGDSYRPRVTVKKDDTERLWERMYYRAKNSRNEMTFKQARGHFFKEQHYYPPETLRLMPLDELDWYRTVKDVPVARLRA